MHWLYTDVQYFLRWKLELLQMERFGRQLLAQIEDWRFSLTGTLTGERILRRSSCIIFRVGDGSVFTKDAGFKLLLGQTEEFPLLQVSLLCLSQLCCKSSSSRLGWSHESLPWKEAQCEGFWKSHHHKQKSFHVEIRGYALLLDSKLESACSDMVDGYGWCQYSFRPLANGDPCSINKGLSICLGDRLTQLPLKVLYVVLLPILVNFSPTL